ncbi:S41 family peptidase [Sorangium sp. So ce131]|uniref:S41 family peptidase n=1 Tax=Sorangium sp. So ce131 TaxID=3133282 RepID=UPI003F605FE0
MPFDGAVTLGEFLEKATGRLSVEAREEIVDQAILLIDQLYAHLPLKRAMFAIDPVQRLRLLRRRLKAGSELGFHREMISIFTELRDLHTLYTLPEPFQSGVVFLPFLIEAFFEGGERRYLVSKVTERVADPHFQPGVLITHWSGVPIRRAVELSAERQPGSTDAARRARGLSAMTLRPMSNTAWPDEEWVDVRYRALDGEIREARFAWRVMPSSSRWIEDERDALENPEALAGGLDRLAESVRRARKALYALGAVEEHEQMATLWAASGGRAPGAAHRLGEQSRLPDNFSFRTVNTPHGDYGYVRIWSFENTTGGEHRKPIRDFVDAFASEFVRILRTLPQRGLILDIRGNPGGRIPAGERLLELLTPAPIMPAPLHFRNTPLAAELCRVAPAVLELCAWEDSVTQSVETGATYSRGCPFLPFSRDYNRTGQQYHGPVILVVDGLCYSTADVFAAGFQDHAIGPVLGVDTNTGAGGGNIWTHEVLTNMLAASPLSGLKPLASGASFTVAVRQVTRVGARGGSPLEDLGVLPDHIHQLTRNDLLNRNEDLIRRAAEILASLPARGLDAALEVKEGALHLTISTCGLTRVDVYVDERPRRSVDVEDGTLQVDLPFLAGAVPERVEVRGFEGRALVARRRLAVPA